MSKVAVAREAHVEFLSRLGFLPDVIEETAQAMDLGLFDLEPSPDLMLRTIEACQRVAGSQAQVAKPHYQPATINPIDMMEAYGLPLSAVASMAGPVARPLLASIGQLVGECLASVGFVNDTGKRPVIMVDNHNVVVPGWWQSDSGFMAVRETLRTVNLAAVQAHASPTAVVMILRPTVGGYDEGDLRALSGALTDKSDVWLVPHQMAGRYRDQGVVVFRDQHALTLGVRYDTPGAAFAGFEETWGKTAGDVGATIEAMADGIVAVRRYDEVAILSETGDGGIKALLEGVITTGKSVRLTY